MSKKNISKYVILGLLNCEPMSGYDIKKNIGHCVQEFWDMGYGSIYPELKSLEAARYTQSAVTKSKGKPDRIVYSITGSGEKELFRWLNEPFDIPKVKNEFLVKFFFTHHFPKDNNIANLHEYRRKIEQQLALFNNRISYADKHWKLNEKEYLITYLAMVEGKYLWEARLKWVDEALEKIKNLPCYKK